MPAIVRLISLGILFVCFTSSASAGKVFYNVLDYGAKGDGIVLETAALNKAIDAAAAAGGGTVYFPPGQYLTFTLRLKSNISLFLDQGAVLIGATPSGGIGYDAPEPKTSYDAYQDFGHNHWKNSLIWGEGLHDISIVGQGLIWGRGLTRSTTQPPGGGNKAIALKWCRNVTIQDISILHGGHFGILATGVDNFVIRNLKIDTDRDGMDIDCCKNVRVSDCLVNSPVDDGICLKSSFGLGVARATENVTITNCQVSGYDQGTLLDGTFKKTPSADPDNAPTGRIKMGTESNGGFKNITISNCVFDYCRGLALETVDGGLLEDVTINNITMRDIFNAPLFIRLGSRMRGPDSIPVGACRRIIISNVVVYNADPRSACIISGIPGHDIEDLELSNIRLYYKGGGTLDMATLNVPEMETAYPEPFRFGPTPAYGFFIRHVHDLRLHDVEIGYIKDDQRSPFYLDDVHTADLHFIRAEKAIASPFLVQHDVSGLTLEYIDTTDEKEVTLDYYFNNEWRKDASGDSVRYHYTWEDTANSGFSKLGTLFRQEGFELHHLTGAPSLDNLRTTAVYIIVDPDTEKESPHPNYVSPADISVLREWVKAGGVLVLMGNDKGNAEFEHFNHLAAVFGIHFNEDRVNHVIGTDIEAGKIHVSGDNPIFTTPGILFMKDVSSIGIQPPAAAALVNQGAILAATARYGKGHVFAVGDPWVYNEYVDDRAPITDCQNEAGAREWIQWLRKVAIPTTL